MAFRKSSGVKRGLSVRRSKVPSLSCEASKPLSLSSAAEMPASLSNLGLNPPSDSSMGVKLAIRSSLAEKVPNRSSAAEKPATLSSWALRPAALRPSAVNPPTRSSARLKPALNSSDAANPTLRSVSAFTRVNKWPRRHEPSTIIEHSSFFQASRFNRPVLAATHMVMVRSRAISSYAVMGPSTFCRSMSAMKKISSRHAPPGMKNGVAFSASIASSPPFRRRAIGMMQPLTADSFRCFRALSVAWLWLSCSSSGTPVAFVPTHVKPLKVRSRLMRLELRESASISGLISAPSRWYGHFHSTIVPFLSASSGKPAPTSQSWSALAPIVRPAARAPNITSIHSFSIAMVEMRIEVGSTAANSSMASSESDAVPAWVR